MSGYSTKTYEKFNVHEFQDNITFHHIDLSDKEDFYKGLYDYFFDETNLLRYAENKKNIKFVPSKRNYITLYKHLGLYIDDYNIKMLPSELESEVLSILNDEYELCNVGDGKLKVRLDKMGKIGEYIFCNLLSNYYGFNCIIPKVHLTTDNNMNVYGIDTLFYSSKEDMILFGESKLSNSLTNGISLINKSLETYENQIKEEFNLMLSSRFLKNNMGIFGKKYNSTIELSLTTEEFIKKANVKKIGIPIFIAHGKDVEVDKIFDKLNKINKTKILGLDTIYLVISLPIFNKSKMISVFTNKIAERRAIYEANR